MPDSKPLCNSVERKPYTFQLSKTGGNVECGFLFYTSTLLIQYWICLLSALMPIVNLATKFR